MAKAKELSYQHAQDCINTAKFWVPGFAMEWTAKGGKGFPAGFGFRAGIMYDGEPYVREGSFVECYYKQETKPGLRHKISLSFFAENARVIGIDEDGLGTHLNKCGIGLPFYQMRVGFPHLHYPVPDSGSLYAEPVDIVEPNKFWEIFLRRANISGAPDFYLPTNDQLRLL